MLDLLQHLIPESGRLMILWESRARQGVGMLKSH